jgi:hypothetical protein
VAEPVDGMQVVMGVDSIINQVQMMVYPVETVGTAMTLWKAQSVLRIAPGSTRVITASFRDEDGERVGAVEVVEPVANTDYTVNEFPDGTGFDYTSSPSWDMDTTIEATRAIFTISSTALGPLYFTLLKIRGKPIRVWDPIVIEEVANASQTAYEKRAVVLDLAMQPDSEFAESYVDYLLGRFKNPFLRVDQVTVRDRDTIGGVNVFSLELMDKVVCHDTETGVSMVQHRVRGVEYDLTAKSYRVDLYLERSDDTQYWLLGKAGYSELGTTTRLGF